MKVTSTVSASCDSELNTRIKNAAGAHEDYWSFRGKSKRSHCHGWMGYPAMMVPDMQGALIDCVLETRPDLNTILDPFVGSGTVLGEAITRGKNFIGADVNPLAVMCCNAKSDYFDLEAIEEAHARVILRISKQSGRWPTVSFPGDLKWFSASVLKALSDISYSIGEEKIVWVRRFLWVALVDIVRVVSNTRQDTYKLHIKKDVASLARSRIFYLFKNKCLDNIKRKNHLWTKLLSDGFINDGGLLSDVRSLVKDCRNLEREGIDGVADLVVTSPPYGDNNTTVTYGQYSFLPLQFINLDDVGADFDRAITLRPSSIDSVSLGGSLGGFIEKRDAVAARSWSLRRAIASVAQRSKSGEKRLVSFSYDLYAAAEGVSRVVSEAGYLMFTLGNRRVSGHQIPLDCIVKDFFETLGFMEVLDLKRAIPQKRMPGTMSQETVLIMRRANS